MKASSFLRIMRRHDSIFHVLPITVISNMYHDGQLTPKEVSAIESWVSILSEHLKKFPELPASVDLVIEGGVDNGITMPHIIPRLFPNALYVGTDISPLLMVGKRRISKQIDDDSLQALIRANTGVANNLASAVLYANCFDGNLIKDIMRKTGRKVPFLVSFNAIASLADPKISIGRKEPKDDIPIQQWFNNDLPYIGQLHVIKYLLDWQTTHPLTIFDYAIRDVLTHAQLNYYIVEQMDRGILVVKS